MRFACFATTLVGIVYIVAACGGGSSSTTTPTTPTPQPQANRAPMVNSVTVNPGFGIQDKTLFNFSVSASDPDGDSLSYGWNIGGSSYSGPNVAITFVSGGAVSASVTVSDGRGDSTNGSQIFVIGSGTGTWAGTSPNGFGTFTMKLTQANG